jgi:putative polymerase
MFVSGIRPAGRFFPFPFEIHRISSVFLEPVSLGFFAFISGLYFVAMKDRLPRSQVLLAIFVTLLLIWLGDARMAFASLVAVILFRPVFARLDHRLTVLIFPAALLFGLFVVESGMFNLTGEGLGARLLWTFQGIWSTKNGQFFGVRPYDIAMVDSGFLYMLSCQGIWGFLLYWLPPIFFKNKFSREARIYWFGASIFLTSGFMVSDAIYTIKTASLLWFCYGYILARTEKMEEEKKK